MIGLRKRPLATTFLVALCLVVFALALDDLMRYSRYSDLHYWAGRIERGKPVGLDTIRSLEPKLISLVKNEECSAEFLRAGLTIRLIEIDSLNQDSNYDRWSDALQNAYEFTNHAITCLPTDSNLWLRLAMLKAAIAEEPAGIARYAALSELYSPADANMIAGRYRLYNVLSRSSLELLFVSFKHDIEVICSANNQFLRRGLPTPAVVLEGFITKLDPGCPIISNTKR